MNDDINKRFDLLMSTNGFASWYVGMMSGRGADDDVDLRGFAWWLLSGGDEIEDYVNWGPAQYDRMWEGWNH